MKNLIFITIIIFYYSAFTQNIDSSYYLDFNIKAKFLEDGGFELENKILPKEFILKGNSNKYSIEILNDSNSVISENTNGLWTSIDTLDHMFNITDSTELQIPSFHIVDFNNDGKEDILIWHMTNVNGNHWTKIYLNNGKTLIKLENTADGEWADPNYQKHKSIITCEEISGNFGVSYTSKYKLNGFIAIPIEKHEIDNTQIKLKNDEYIGQIFRDYIGKNGKWQLLKHKKK